MIQVTPPRDTDALFTWCKIMHDAYPLPQHFAAGVVALGAAIDWMYPPIGVAQPTIAFRKYCGAALNFIAAALAEGLSIRSDFPETLEDIRDYSHRAESWRELLRTVAAAQEQFLLDMFDHDSGAHERALGALAVTCLQLVPPAQRAGLCCEEMQVIAERISELQKTGQ